jgi:hypothetical protein
MWAYVLPWVFSFSGLVLFLYLLGIVRAYRAVPTSDWKGMDLDVRTVYLLLAPIALTIVDVVMIVDRLFYTPWSWSPETGWRRAR